MIYLNEPDEGGETDFMHVGVCVAPRQGMLLAWNNANREGVVNTYTQHAAKPVLKGRNMSSPNGIARGNGRRGWRMFRVCLRRARDSVPLQSR
jgi:hypothetical protein